MSFYYLNQTVNNDSSPFENFGFNDKNFNFENFESMPPVDAKNSDSSYQCSDNVQITGNVIGSSIANSTLADCKSQCNSDSTCIGFDFDNASSSCTLKNTITDLTSSKQNNVMCIKKTLSACKVQVNPEAEAHKIITEHESETSPVPGIEIPVAPLPTNPIIRPIIKPIPAPITPERMGPNKCKPDTIFVDLPCFLNKMDVLKNHSDNLMIDLQLLLTNLKSCAYVRKPAKKQATSNPFKPINSNSDGNSDDDWNISTNLSMSGSSSLENSSTVSNSNVPVVMPTQDTIKVYNSQASVLYTNNPITNSNVMLGITEPFQNSEQETSFVNTYTFKIIVLIFLLVLLMNMK